MAVAGLSELNNRGSFSDILNKLLLKNNLPSIKLIDFPLNTTTVNIDVADDSLFGGDTEDDDGENYVKLTTTDLPADMGSLTSSFVPIYTQPSTSSSPPPFKVVTANARIAETKRVVSSSKPLTSGIQIYKRKGIKQATNSQTIYSQAREGKVFVECGEDNEAEVLKFLSKGPSAAAAKYFDVIIELPNKQFYNRLHEAGSVTLLHMHIRHSNKYIYSIYSYFWYINIY